MDKLLADIEACLKPEIIWALVGIVLLLLEFMMPGLIIAFFGIGALVVALICLLTDISLNIQLLIFILSSVASVLILRRWLKGIFMGHTTSKQDMAGDLNEFIGEKAVVTAAITPQAGGRVELHGTSWKATADQQIDEGTIVEVTGKDNITLKIKPL